MGTHHRLDNSQNSQANSQIGSNKRGTNLKDQSMASIDSDSNTQKFNRNGIIYRSARVSSGQPRMGTGNSISSGGQFIETKMDQVTNLVDKIGVSKLQGKNSPRSGSSLTPNNQNSNLIINQSDATNQNSNISKHRKNSNSNSISQHSRSQIENSSNHHRHSLVENSNQGNVEKSSNQISN